MLIALLLAVQGTPPVFPPDLNETTVERVGAFTIEHQRFERRGVPIMHVASAWQKVRLVWRSRDDAVKVVFEDDGEALRVSLDAGKTANGPICLASGPVSAYGPIAGTPERWRGGFRLVADLVAPCKLFDRVRLAALKADYDAAAADFPRVSARFRAVASGAFGSIAHRCVRFGARGGFDPFQGPPCVRWSDDASAPRKRR